MNFPIFGAFWRWTLGGVGHSVVEYVNGFTLIPLNWYIDVFEFNSKCTVLGCITYIAALRLQYLDYKELIKLFMTILSYLIILKQP
jgi:hypothetical protein